MKANLKNITALLCVLVISLTFSSCGDSKEQSYDTAEETTDHVQDDINDDSWKTEPANPNRVQRAAIEQASRNFYGEMRSREYNDDPSNYDLPSDVQEEDSVEYDREYKNARRRLSAVEYPSLSDERQKALEQEGFDAGSAAYKSAGMTTRNTREYDWRYERPAGEMEYLLKGFDNGWADANFDEKYIPTPEEKEKVYNLIRSSLPNLRKQKMDSEAAQDYILSKYPKMTDAGQFMLFEVLVGLRDGETGGKWKDLNKQEPEAAKPASKSKKKKK